MGNGSALEAPVGMLSAFGVRVGSLYPINFFAARARRFCSLSFFRFDSFAASAASAAALVIALASAFAAKILSLFR